MRALAMTSPTVRKVGDHGNGVRAPANTRVWIEPPPGTPVPFKGRKAHTSPLAKATFEARIAGSDVVDG